MDYYLNNGFSRGDCTTVVLAASDGHPDTTQIKWTPINENKAQEWIATLTPLWREGNSKFYGYL